MRVAELPDYGDWTDRELADELDLLDKNIENCQKAIATQRRSMNSAMEAREDVLDIIKQRANRTRWS